MEKQSGMSKIRKWWPAVVAALLGILIVVLFIKNKNQIPIESVSSIRIGVMLCLTGDSANYGKRSLNGVNWATQKINDKGGINGKRIKLFVEDDRSSPKDAVTAFNKLTQAEGIKIVVGDIISGTTLAVAPIAEKNHVLLFAPGASNPQLRDSGDYIFRNWTSDDFDGKAMARYLEKKGVKSLGILVQKTDYTIGLADALAKDFKSLDRSIVSRQEFETDEKDLRTQLLKLKESGVRDVYISAYSPGTGIALKQAAEIGYSPHWYASLTVDTPECATIAGKARDGVIFSTPAFNINDPSPEMKIFVQGYKERFGEDPETVTGHAYDAINILAMAIEKVGPDPTKIKDELYKIKNFSGVTGKTSFDDHGDVVKGIQIKQIRGGKPVIIDYFQP